MSKKAISLDEHVERVRSAIYRAVGNTRYSDYADDFYVELVYDGYAIIRTYGSVAASDHYRVNYSEADDGTIEVQGRTEWQRVEKEWAAKSTLIGFGDRAIKALGEGKIGGYLVRFSTADDPDLAGDYFDASTDFDIESGAKTAVYYNHGLDPVLKGRKLGTGTLTQDEHGIWLEAQLTMRDQYERAIYGMVEAGKCGLSSGSVAHLVERDASGKAAHIKRWPLGLDASITPTPCEPKTSVVPLKSYIADLQHTPQANAQEAGNASADATAQTGHAAPPQPTIPQETSSPMDENAIKQLIADALKQVQAPQAPAPVVNVQPAAPTTPAVDTAQVIRDAVAEAMKAAMVSAPAQPSAGVVTPHAPAAPAVIKTRGEAEIGKHGTPLVDAIGTRFTFAVRADDLAEAWAWLMNGVGLSPANAGQPDNQTTEPAPTEPEPQPTEPTPEPAPTEPQPTP